jgi:hypothetical protein
VSLASGIGSVQSQIDRARRKEVHRGASELDSRATDARAIDHDWLLSAALRIFLAVSKLGFNNGRNMFFAYVIVTILAVTANIYAATNDFRRLDWVLAHFIGPQTAVRFFAVQ